MLRKCSDGECLLIEEYGLNEKKKTLTFLTRIIIQKVTLQYGSEECACVEGTVPANSIYNVSFSSIIIILMALRNKLLTKCSAK